MSVEFNPHYIVLNLLGEFFCWTGTLKEYLELICDSENVGTEKRQSILDDKSNEYQSHLADIIVACRCNNKLLPKSPVSFSAFCSLDDVIYRIIGEFCTKQKQDDNLLSIGSSISRHDSFRGSMSLQSNVQCDYPNSMVSYVTSKIWEILLSKIGNDVISHLFGKLSLFQKMPSGCLMQICGKPFENMEPKSSDHKCFKGNPSSSNNKSRVDKKPLIKSCIPSTNELQLQCQGKGNCTAESLHCVSNELAAEAFDETNGSAHDQKCHTFTKLKPTSEVKLKSCNETKDADIYVCENSMEVGNRTPSCSSKVLSKKKRKRAKNSTSVSCKKDEHEFSFKDDGNEVDNDYNDLQNKRRKVPEKHQTEYKVPKSKTQCNEPDEICLGNPGLHFEKIHNDVKMQDDKTLTSLRKRKFFTETQIQKMPFDCNDSDGPSEKRKRVAGSRSATERREPAIGGDSPKRTDGCRTALQMNDQTLGVPENNTVHLTNLGPSEIPCESRMVVHDTKVGKIEKLELKNEPEAKIQENKAHEKGTKNIPFKQVTNSCTRNTSEESVAGSKQKQNNSGSSVSFCIARCLYSTCEVEKLRESHILTSVNDCKKDAVTLAAEIFLAENGTAASDKAKLTNGKDGCIKDVKSEPSNKRNVTEKNRPKLPRNLMRTVTFFRDFIRRFKKLKIKPLLAKVCPVAANVKKSMAYSEEEMKEKKIQVYKTALLNFTFSKKVSSFIITVCKKTIPKTLLGNKANWKTFFKHVRKLFELGKNETMTLSQFMNGIKISDCSWMLKSGVKPKQIPKSLSEWQEIVQFKLVRWLVGDFILPLTCAFFYITESAMHRNRLFYYRKPVWKIIEKLGKDSFLKNNLIEINENDVQRLEDDKTLESATVRFIPKANKTRPIINLHKVSSKNGVSSNHSVNYELKSLFHVLTNVQEQNKELIGSAVYGLADVNLKLRGFVADLKKNSMGDTPMYWVASDIDSCFDSIPHDKLIDVILRSMDNYTYTIRKFAAVTSDAENKLKFATKRYAAYDRDCDYFPVFLQKALLTKKCRVTNAIITDKVYYSTEEKEELIALLTKHVQQSYIKIDSNYYQRVKGIAQGSILSTILANFIYGDMERQHFNDILNSNESLLMRWTDDFLLVTTSQETAVNFLKKLQAGFPEYGCTISVSKSLTNLPHGLLGPKDDIKRLEGDWLPWCSLLFNAKTLNVRVSFERYRGELISDAITEKQMRAPGKQLTNRLLRQVRNQSISLILDPEINSLQNIKLNIFQVFCFMAVKLNCQVLNIPKHRQPNCNPEFFKRLLNQIFGAFYAQYARVGRKLGLQDIPISKTEAKDIFLAAFYNILSRKECRYRLIMKWLRKDFKKAKIDKGQLELYEKESELFRSIR